MAAYAGRMSSHRYRHLFCTSLHPSGSPDERIIRKSIADTNPPPCKGGARGGSARSAFPSIRVATPPPFRVRAETQRRREAEHFPTVANNRGRFASRTSLRLCVSARTESGLRPPAFNVGNPLSRLPRIGVPAPVRGSLTFVPSTPPPEHPSPCQLCQLNRERRARRPSRVPGGETPKSALSDFPLAPRPRAGHSR